MEIERRIDGKKIDSLSASKKDTYRSILGPAPLYSFWSPYKHTRGNLSGRSWKTITVTGNSLVTWCRKPREIVALGRQRKSSNVAQWYSELWSCWVIRIFFIEIDRRRMIPAREMGRSREKNAEESLGIFNTFITGDNHVLERELWGTNWR